MTGAHAQTALATLALEQLRAEVLARKGRKVIYLYLTRLAACASGGAVLGLLLYALALHGQVPPGFGLVLAGSMAGAWLSAASNRRDVTFDELPDYLGSWREPVVRVAFVAVLATVVALFVRSKLVNVQLGEVNFVRFQEDGWAALVLGVIAGVGERALSVKLLQRVGEFTTK